MKRPTNNFTAVRKMLFTGLFFMLVLMAPQKVTAQFAKGADISWISEMEASGYQWYNDNGSQQDIYQILKDHGMNAIRLRVWVNPSGGWCDLDDMIYMAQRASNAGMDILLTIHYSDSWADPGQQNKPGAWTGLSFQGLMDQVYSYTYDVISTMQSNNVTPKWVQIGNETNDGMLWEDGRASANMQNYAWLINSGHNAVKDVNSGIQTIVHLSNGYDNALYQWNIGGIIDNGANFDIIGMSLYPDPGNWSSLNDQCLNNMSDMQSRYGKEVMICEVGMRADEPEACRDFIADIISKTRSVGGLGVFYWEPQVYDGWKGYGKGAWQEDGRPSVAMDAFLEGGGSSGGSSGGSGGSGGSGSSSGGSSGGGDNGSFNGTYSIIASHSGKALDTYNWGTSDGTNIVQWNYWGGDAQQFNISSVDGDWHRITPAIASDQSLDVDGISTGDGANIHTWTYWGNDNQQFRFESAGSGEWHIVARHSGKCFDVEGSSSDDGANVIQNTCNGASNQTFEVISPNSAVTNAMDHPDQLEIYPNPVNHNLKLNIPDHAGNEITISIVNHIGQEVLNRNNLSAGLNAIDVRSLNPGLYFIRMKQGEEWQTRKFTKH